MSRNAQGTISDGNETPLMQKRTLCEQKRVQAEMHMRRSATGMKLCQCRNALPVSRNAQGTISDRNETLSMQIRTLCEQKRV